jgi:(4S)-4-hydroxy-5-phosphonooxypentane-2,3-dione isomerase
MSLLLVSVKVRPERVADFIAATLANAAASRAEAGVARFELLQDQADPTRFVLLEDYRDAGAQAAHKETAHYLAWKSAAEPMMAEPRTRASYSPIEP